MRRKKPDQRFRDRDIRNHRPGCTCRRCDGCTVPPIALPSTALARTDAAAPVEMRAPPSLVEDATGIYVRVPAAALPIVELARQGRDVVDLGKAIAQGIEAFAETLGKLTAPKRRRRR